MKPAPELPAIATTGTSATARPSRRQVAATPPGRIRQRPLPEAAPAAPPSDSLPHALESLLFVASGPAELAALARVLRVPVADVERAAEDLAACLRGRGLRLQRGNGCLQLVTAPEWSRYVERYLGIAAEQPLSAAALETLAIIAYRQPVTRATIESVRGVNAERALATLRARGLIEEAGRAEAIGRPLLFGTTMQFLEYVGIERLDDLPPLPAEEGG